jgi:hypothetical protein
VIVEAKMIGADQSSEFFLRILASHLKPETPNQSFVPFYAQLNDFTLPSLPIRTAGKGE